MILLYTEIINVNTWCSEGSFTGERVSCVDVLSHAAIRVSPYVLKIFLS